MAAMLCLAAMLMMVSQSLLTPSPPGATGIGRRRLTGAIGCRLMCRTTGGWIRDMRRILRLVGPRASRCWSILGGWATSRWMCCWLGPCCWPTVRARRRLLGVPLLACPLGGVWERSLVRLSRGWRRLGVAMQVSLATSLLSPMVWGGCRAGLRLMAAMCRELSRLLLVLQPLLLPVSSTCIVGTGRCGIRSWTLSPVVAPWRGSFSSVGRWRRCLSPLGATERI